MFSKRAILATKRPNNFLTTSVSSSLEMPSVPPQKRMCTVVRPKICIYCFNGESAHITHLLMDMPVAPLGG